jgi:hypothetical protein
MGRVPKRLKTEDEPMAEAIKVKVKVRSDDDDNKEEEDEESLGGGNDDSQRQSD